MDKISEPINGEIKSVILLAHNIPPKVFQLIENDPNYLPQKRSSRTHTQTLLNDDDYEEQNDDDDDDDYIE